MSLAQLIAAGSNRFVAALRVLGMRGGPMFDAIRRRHPLQPANSLWAAISAGDVSRAAGQLLGAQGNLGSAPASQVPGPLPGQTGYRTWVVVRGIVPATGAERNILVAVDTPAAPVGADVAAQAAAMGQAAFVAGSHPTFGYAIEGGLSVTGTEFLSVERH